MALARVDRRTEILDAAAALFARRGFNAVGMDDIAEALGISGPALYWHFAGKDELLAALLAAEAERYAAGFATLAAAPRVTADDLAGRVLQLFLESPDRAAAYTREAHRAAGAAAEPQARMFEAGRRAGRRLRETLPFELDSVRLGVRLGALRGPLLSLTFDPPSLPRRRIAELGTTAGSALLSAPPRPARPVATAPGWRPTRSRREQILAAARELFEERGFHAVTVNDIGEALGMRGPSIYRHFASKRELLAASWDRVAARFTAGALDALADAESASDALVRLALSVTEVVVDSHGLIRMTYLDVDNRPEYIGSWSQWRPFVVEAWRDVLAELRDDLGDAEVAFVVEMTLAALVEACVTGGGPADLAELVEEIAHLGVAFATARPAS